MLNLKKLQTSTALALALGVTATGAAPIVFAKDAIATPAPIQLAQLFPSRPAQNPVPNQTYGAVRIPAGTTIRLAYPEAEKIVVAPNERVPMTLTIPNNIRASNGALLIPRDSKVKGEFQPADGGTRFVATTLILPNGNQLSLDGQTDIVTRTEEIQQGADTGSILKGAAIGSGAAAIISAITKNRVTLGRVLIGTGAGALGGLLLGRNRNQVLSVNPQTDLNLRFNSSLAVNPY
ncbi:MAG TPA: hypothetical protein VL134_12610 [Leptolyngbya sp.]|jgi:hypothetical protein|nr:hypothetical protein [Leptolyngbya sp.]